MKRRLYKIEGRTVDFHGDGKGGATIHMHGDVGPLLEQNERIRNSLDISARRKSDFRDIAHIDDVTFVRWLQEEHLTMQQVADPVIMDRLLRKKLNDGDNAKFRTGPERL